jgi:hypothetical protein
MQPSAQCPAAVIFPNLLFNLSSPFRKGGLRFHCVLYSSGSFENLRIITQELVMSRNVAHTVTIVLLKRAETGCCCFHAYAVIHYWQIND